VCSPARHGRVQSSSASASITPSGSWTATNTPSSTESDTASSTSSASSSDTAVRALMQLASLSLSLGFDIIYFVRRASPTGRTRGICVLRAVHTHTHTQDAGVGVRPSATLHSCVVSAAVQSRSASSTVSATSSASLTATPSPTATWTPTASAVSGSVSRQARALRCHAPGRLRACCCCCCCCCS